MIDIKIDNAEKRRKITIELLTKLFENIDSFPEEKLIQLKTMDGYCFNSK